MAQDRDHTKVHIEHAIGRAREGVSVRIDEIDRRLRGGMNVREKAGQYAPHLIAAGAVTGFLIGFGFPKVIKRLLQFGLPIAIAMKIAQMQSDEVHGPGPGDAGFDIS